LINVSGGGIPSTWVGNGNKRIEYERAEVTLQRERERERERE